MALPVKHIRVVAGVIFNQQQQILLSTRPHGKSYEGYWEFAGGKIEPDETETQALKRELLEELNINVQRAYSWLTKTQNYGSVKVHLHFFKVTKWQGEMLPKEGQQLSWQDPDNLTVNPILMANSSIIKSLLLPQIFKGNLVNGFTGKCQDRIFCFRPLSLVQKGEGLLLDYEDFISRCSNKSMKNKQNNRPTHEHQWVAVPIRTLADWRKCYKHDIGVVIFTVLNTHDIHRLTGWLKKGMPTPLIIHNPNKLNLKSILLHFSCSTLTT